MSQSTQCLGSVAPLAMFIENTLVKATQEVLARCRLNNPSSANRLPIVSGSVLRRHWISERQNTTGAPFGDEDSQLAGSLSSC